MNIAIGSCFRNSAGYPINRWMRQVARLQDWAAHRWHDLNLICVWGDSTDDTRQELINCTSALCGARTTAEVVERSHGGPVFGSTEAPERMKALSYVGNGIFESVGPDIDILIYVESDLMWQPETLGRLMNRLNETDIVAPLVFAGQAFYDIWGFRSLEGERFGPFHPYNRTLRHDGQLTEVSSVGSCLVMRGEVARECRIIDDECLVGFCKDARSKGYRVSVDSSERIEHP